MSTTPEMLQAKKDFASLRLKEFKKMSKSIEKKGVAVKDLKHPYMPYNSLISRAAHEERVKFDSIIIDSIIKKLAAKGNNFTKRTGAQVSKQINKAQSKTVDQGLTM